MKKTETPEAAKIKAYTEAGAVVARYTMQVIFRKEFYGVNKSTGEIITRWTYRSDLVQAEYLKHKRELAPLDALAWKYKAIRARILECKVYDNSLPAPASLIFHEADGVVLLQKNRNEL